MRICLQSSTKRILVQNTLFKRYFGNQKPQEFSSNSNKNSQGVPKTDESEVNPLSKKANDLGKESKPSGKEYKVIDDSGKEPQKGSGFGGSYGAQHGYGTINPNESNENESVNDSNQGKADQKINQKRDRI